MQVRGGSARAALQLGGSGCCAAALGRCNGRAPAHAPARPQSCCRRGDCATWPPGTGSKSQTRGSSSAAWCVRRSRARLPAAVILRRSAEPVWLPSPPLPLLRCYPPRSCSRIRSTGGPTNRCCCAGRRTCRCRHKQPAAVVAKGSICCARRRWWLRRCRPRRTAASRTWESCWHPCCRRGRGAWR